MESCDDVFSLGSEWQAAFRIPTQMIEAIVRKVRYIIFLQKPKVSLSVIFVGLGGGYRPRVRQSFDCRSVEGKHRPFRDSPPESFRHPKIIRHQSYCDQRTSRARKLFQRVLRGDPAG